MRKYEPGDIVTDSSHLRLQRYYAIVNVGQYSYSLVSLDSGLLFSWTIRSVEDLSVLVTDIFRENFKNHE